MEDHFNGLTPAEAERLAMLAEEAAEVVLIVGKILRHGYESYHPDDPTTTNRELLRQEITDFMGVKWAMVGYDDIDTTTHEQVKAAWEKKLRYAHHQDDDL